MFYLDKTARKVAQLFHTAASTIYYRKKKVLGKYRIKVSEHFPER